MVIQFFLHVIVDFYLLVYRFADRFLGKRSSCPLGRRKSILLTGTFYSTNWIMNHLAPLAMSKQVKEIKIVCTFPIPETVGVEWIRIPRWAMKAFGETPSRLILFTIIALRCRPDIIGGFHLLVNGLHSIMLAKLLQRQSLYINGGGPREIIGGGYLGNRLFSKLRHPDDLLEKKLAQAVDSADLVVTMGHSVIDYFRGKSVATRMEVVPGGIDGTRYRVSRCEKMYDIIIVGRIVQVKRIDIYLRAIKKLSLDIPSIKAVVIGVGELLDEFKNLAIELGINDNVTFAGHQSDVISWLHKSKLFVLTSDSEGLSLALMEAMMCGLPAVVSDVGELGELVEDGVNGFLVASRDPNRFARKIQDSLTNAERLSKFSINARRAAMRFDIQATSKRWDKILRSPCLSINETEQQNIDLERPALGN